MNLNGEFIGGGDVHFLRKRTERAKDTMRTSTRPKCGEQYGNRCFAIFIYATMIVDLFRKVNILWVGLPNSSVMVFRNVIYVLLFVYIMRHAVARKRTWGLFWLSTSFVALLSLSYILNPEIQPLMADAVFIFFARLMPAYYIMRYTVEWHLILDEIARLRWIALAYALVVLIYPETASNYLPLAYNLMIPTAVILHRAISKKKSGDFALAGLFLSVMLVYGARGPIVCILCSMLIYVIVSYRHWASAKKVFLLLSGVLLLTILFLSFPTLIELLYEAFPDSRTVGLLNSRRFFSMSNRDSYYEFGLREVAQTPFRIQGLFGDRLTFADAFSQQLSPGMYAHNFFVEILLQFGAIIGGLIIILVMVVMTTSTIRVFSTANNEAKGAYAIFFGAPVVYSMISGSYLSSYEIWLMFGLLMNFFRRNGRS